MSIDVSYLCPLLEVFDMPTSIRFYRDVLGFEIVQTSDPLGPEDDFDWVWLRLKDTNLMLNTAYEGPDRPSTPDPARTATHADTGLYFGCPDVDAAYRHLREHGLDVAEPKVAPYGMKQLYVKDPDGYNLCFQWQAT